MCWISEHSSSFPLLSLLNTAFYFEAAQWAPFAQRAQCGTRFHSRSSPLRALVLDMLSLPFSISGTMCKGCCYCFSSECFKLEKKKCNSQQPASFVAFVFFFLSFRPIRWNETHSFCYVTTQFYIWKWHSWKRNLCWLFQDTLRCITLQALITTIWTRNSRPGSQPVRNLRFRVNSFQVLLHRNRFKKKKHCSFCVHKSPNNRQFWVPHVLLPANTFCVL